MGESVARAADSERDAPARDETGGEGLRKRRPGRFRRWVLRPLCWGLLVVVLLLSVLQLVLNTRWARDKSRHLIADAIGNYFEREVEIGDISIELLPLTVEVWGLRIGGPEGEEDADMLFVPYALIDGDLAAFEQKRIRMRRIRVEQPVVDLVYFLDGTSNLVNFRRSGKGRRFDVYIDRLEIDRAEFLVDHERVELSVNADSMQASFQGLGEMHLDGQIMAREAVLLLPNANPITLGLSVKGSFHRGWVGIEEARIRGDRVELDVSGECEWSRIDRNDRKCDLDARGDVSGALLAQLGYFQDLEGGFQVDGRYYWRPGVTGWRSRVRGEELSIWDRQLQDVDGVLVADRYGARFGLERARYGGGVVDGEITWESDEPGNPYTVDLRFRGVELDPLLEDQGIAVRGFASRVDGQLAYRFLQKRSRLGQGRAEVRLVADEELQGLGLEGSFPLRIVDGEVRAESASVGSAEQSVLAAGRYHLDTRRGRFNYEIASADLTQLTPLLPLSEDDPQPLWLPTVGGGEITGTLFLEPDDLWSTLDLRWEEVSTPSLAARGVRGSLRVDRDSVDSLYLELGDSESSLVMRGRIPFDTSSDVRGSELSFDAYLWPVDQIRPWLSFDLPFDGALSGRMDLHVGAEGSDGRLAASLAPAELRLETGTGPRDVPFDSLSGVLTWDTQQMVFEHFLAESEAGAVSGKGTYAYAGLLDLELPETRLELSAPPLRDFLPRSDLGGVVRMRGEVEGVAGKPRVDLVFEADTIELGERRLEGQPSKLTVRWQERQLQASGRLLDRLDVEGGGLLSSREMDLTFGVDGRDLGGLAELLSAEPPDVGGRLEGQLTLRGATGAIPDAVLQVDDLALRLRQHQLVSSGPAALHFGVERVRFEDLTLEEPSTGSRFVLDGAMGYGAFAPLEFDLESEFDTTWLEFFDLGFDLDGRLAVQGAVSGTYDRPLLTGRGFLKDGIMPLGENSPQRLEGLQGKLDFSPDLVVFESLLGTLGGGRVELSGLARLPPAPTEGEGAEPLSATDLRSFLPQPPKADGPALLATPMEARVAQVGVGSREGSYEYRVQVEGQGIQMRYPEGWVMEGDTSLSMRSVPGGHLVEGAARLERMEYLDEIRLDFEQLMRGFLERRRLEVAPTDSLLSGIALDIDLEAPGTLRVANDFADLSGSVDLLLRGNLAAPILFGELAFDPGGELVYNGTDYRIARGRVLFTNPYALDPEVELEAKARVRDFDVTLSVAGTFDRLETRFSSEPPLPDLEVFRLLASGEDVVEEADSLEIRPLRRPDEDPSASAATFLYGQAASVIGERVNTLFGFDKFRIDPLTGSGGDNLSKARVTVGKRLSKDVFLTFSTTPSSTEAQRVQIEWQVSPALKLIFSQNGDDTYSADARWEASF